MSFYEEVLLKIIHMEVNICGVLSRWSVELLECSLSPLVLGRIQVTAQWIFSGQPLKTLEKQAPICRNHISNRTTKNKCSSYSSNHAYMDLRGRRKSVTVSPLRCTKTQKVDKSVKNHSYPKAKVVFITKMDMKHTSSSAFFLSVLHSGDSKL